MGPKTLFESRNCSRTVMRRRANTCNADYSLYTDQFIYQLLVFIYLCIKTQWDVHTARTVRARPRVRTSTSALNF